MSCKSCARISGLAETLRAAIHTACKGLWMRDEEQEKEETKCPVKNQTSRLLGFWFKAFVFKFVS